MGRSRDRAGVNGLEAMQATQAIKGHKTPYALLYLGMLRKALIKMSWKRRIAHDIADLTANGFQVLPDGSDDITLDCFRVVLVGPKETPYEGGQWHIRFTVATTFPFTSPSVGFVQHILHPNIDWSSGSVCLDALNKKWTPIFTLKHIMETLLPYLLAYPNPDDPLNREAAALMRDHPLEYTSKVLDTTKKFGVL